MAGWRTQSRWGAAGLLLLALSLANVGRAQTTPGADAVRKVLVIGVDGMRADAMEMADTPHLNSLHENGAGLYMRAYNEDLTFSGPNWSTIINGVHHDRHGVRRNSFDGHDFSAHPNLLRRLKDHNPELFTASFIAWDPLLNNFTLPDGTPDGVDFLFHYEGGDNFETENDELLTQTLVSLLTDGNPDAIFIRIGELDGAGHINGFSPDVPAYMEQVRKTDDYVGRILKAMRARPGVAHGREDWLVVFTTDHGGFGTGHSGNLITQRVIPFIVSGSSVHTGEPPIRPRNVDVTRTVLTFMGVPDALQDQVDGHPVGVGSVWCPALDYHQNLIINGNAELDRGFTDQGMDQAVSGWQDQEHTGTSDGQHSMTVLEYGTPGVFPASDDPGPDARGLNFFAGGSKGNSSKMTQHLDLQPLADAIDDRAVEFHLSAYLGSPALSPDGMRLTAYFYDERRQLIETAILDHEPGKGLLYGETTGVVPLGARSVLFELQAFSSCGAPPNPCTGIQAFADEMSFVIRPLDR